MAEDRSLDEFLGTAEPADPEPDEGPAATAEEAADPSAAAPDPEIEPLAETFAWSAGGGECADCGATVEARWHDDGGLVCADCKAW